MVLGTLVIDVICCMRTHMKYSSFNNMISTYFFCFLALFYNGNNKLKLVYLFKIVKKLNTNR